MKLTSALVAGIGKTASGDRASDQARKEHQALVLINQAKLEEATAIIKEINTNFCSFLKDKSCQEHCSSAQLIHPKPSNIPDGPAG